MDRARYSFIRQGGGGGRNNHHNNHSNSSLSSSSSSSLSSAINNHYDNHHMPTNRNSNNSISSNLHYNNTSSSSAVYSAHMSNNNNTNNSNVTRESLTQHDELIRYIREAWTKVSEQGTPVVSCSDSDNQLKNFKPFNLEEYWGRRLVQNIHISSHGHQ
uniref:Uncharacterized protein n=1 Tax=Glossina brevipalpis TaxID=37001 RepID=A0A1A9WKC9_9MUSC